MKQLALSIFIVVSPFFALADTTISNSNSAIYTQFLQCNFDICSMNFDNNTVIHSIVISTDQYTTQSGNYIVCTDSNNLYINPDGFVNTNNAGVYSLTNANIYCGSSILVNSSYAGTIITVEYSYVSTSTVHASIVDISFGIAVIIALLSFILVGFMYNSIKTKKQWR